MATEPERKIEQLLRTYAQKRGEQAGEHFEMHPATRRLLQEEVARLQKAGAEEEHASWVQILSIFWVKAGLVLSILVVLGVVTFSIRPWEKHNQLAANNRAAERSPARMDLAYDSKKRVPPDMLPSTNLDEKRQLTETLASKDVPAGAVAAPRSGLTDEVRRNPEVALAETEKKSKAAEERFFAKGAATSSASAPARDFNVATTPPLAPAPATPAQMVAAAPRLKAAIPTEAAKGVAATTPAAPAAPMAAPAGQPQSASGFAGTQLRREGEPAATRSVGGRVGGYGGGGFGGRAPGGVSRGMALAEQSAPATSGAVNGMAADKLTPTQTPSGDLSSPQVANRLRSLLKSETAPTDALRAQKQASNKPANLEMTDSVNSTTNAKVPAAAQYAMTMNKPAVSQAPAGQVSPPLIREQFASLPGAEGNLLNSFVLERSGDKIRLIDGDGSVYEGELLGAPHVQASHGIEAYSFARQDSAVKEQPEALQKQLLGITNKDRALGDMPALAQTVPGGLRFRVSGLSRTSQQTVEIVGSLGAPLSFGVAGRKAQAASDAYMGRGMAGVASKAKEAEKLVADNDAGPAPASNAVLLQGTAKTADGKQVAIQAVRISPPAKTEAKPGK